MNPDVPTVARLLARARDLIDPADAALLLAHALGKSRSWLFAHADDAPGEAEAARFDVLLARRAAGEPVAYLTGWRGFWTLELAVTPATLVPRPETELLVDLALARLPVDAPVRVADLGTGSGAIALALSKERPRAQVVATDASPEALDVARGNAVRNGIGNFFRNLGGPVNTVNAALAGLTPGADYWLGTAGGVTSTPLDPDADVGSLDQYLGRAASATELVTAEHSPVYL